MLSLCPKRVLLDSAKGVRREGLGLVGGEGMLELPKAVLEEKKRTEKSSFISRKNN